jgi:tRNA nucleotidyltransferase (CCA-adding enzyme)
MNEMPKNASAQGFRLTPPPGALAVLAGLHAAGHEAWLVGGCVRDGLLGRAVNDWDIATNAHPSTVAGLFEKVISTGLQHGTVTVVEQGEPIEVTTYRIEGEYLDGRRPTEVAFTSDLTADLARRDFTINAMAWDPLRSAIVDPFDGQGDLQARRIRAVGRAFDRFSEDGLRPMRAVRFATVLDLTIEPETWRAITETLDTFAKVSVERIAVEFSKLLRVPLAPRGLGQLRDCGLLMGFLPEVAGLSDERFERVCAALPPLDEDGRLAVLLLASGLDARRFAQRLKLSNALRNRLADLTAHDVDPTHLMTPFDLRRFVAPIKDLPAWLAVRRAWSKSPADWDALQDRITACDATSAPSSPKQLAVDGKTVMAWAELRPSARLGRILTWLLEAVWRDEAPNTAEGLRAILPAALAAVPE